MGRYGSEHTGGVSRYQQGIWTIFTTADGLVSNYVNAILEASDGALWFGTIGGGGVSRYHQGTWTSFNTADGLVSDNVITILEASDGALWFGTWGGVSRYQQGTWTTFTSNSVFAILEASNGALWFGTIHGVSRYQQGTWKSFDIDDGLAANTVYAIVEASDGALWFATPGMGVSRYQNDIIAPPPPINLKANGANPSPWQQNNNEFTISWQNPADLSGIARYFYKFGAEPEHNFDITATVDATADFNPRIIVKAEKELGDTLHVWLEDYAGNIDYHNHSSVELRYYSTGSKDIKIISPKPGEHLSEYVFIMTNTFNFAIDSCALEYQIGSHQSMEIEIPLDSLKNKNQFAYVWHTNEIGEVTLRLSIWNVKGERFIDEVQFVLDQYSTIPTAIILEPLNDDFVHDIIGITGYALGDDFEFYALYLSPKNQIFDNKMLIKSTSEKGKQLAEEFIKLNTKDYPDGEYTLTLEVQNKDSTKKGHAISIIFDNTSPTAQILTPLDNDTLSCFVQIQGTVADSNLQCATLEICECGAPIMTVLDTILTNGIFMKQLNTLDLYGNYNIQLSAKDKGGLSKNVLHTYFMNNQRNDMRSGITKTSGEFRFFLPPHGYKPGVICLEKKDKEKFNFPDEIIPTDLIVQIHSDIADQDSLFDKQGVLTIKYSAIPENSYQEGTLSVYQRIWENNIWEWKFLGGTVDKNNKEITTIIPQLGVYALCSNLEEIEFESKNLQVSFQPWIFSPQGGGHDVQTAISFELGKASNVIIKIYNPAGRLVKVLTENENMSHGNNVVYWDGKDQQGEFCVSGLYIVTIQAEEKMATKTLVVLNK